VGNMIEMCDFIVWIGSDVVWYLLLCYLVDLLFNFDGE